jgi:hypothetical protein
MVTSAATNGAWNAPKPEYESDTEQQSITPPSALTRMMPNGIDLRLDYPLGRPGDG